jgi:hypothetical protein
MGRKFSEVETPHDVFLQLSGIFSAEGGAWSDRARRVRTPAAPRLDAGWRAEDAVRGDEPPQEGSGAAAGGPQQAPQVHLRQVLLSPEEAAGLLERRHPTARLLDGSIRAYAQAMREGRWVPNGMPVILSREGVLLDGVQRLAAAVQSGVALNTLLAEGVEDSAFYSIDQHRRRSLAGILRPRGVQHHHLLAGLMMRLVRYDEGTLTGPASPPASLAQLEQILGSSTAHHEALSRSLAMPDSPLPEPVRSMILFMGYQVNPAATDRLLQAVRAPDLWPPDEPGVLLRQEIERGQEDAAAAPSTTKLIALSIKALNATMRGEKPRRLTWAERPVGGRSAEPFPKLEGYAGLAPLSPAANPGTTALPGQFAGRIEVIDVAAAQRYLTMNQAGRKPVKAHVDAIARDIRRGRWIANAQPICFSRSGVLMNGQHRLLAVVASQGRIEVPVIHGLPDEAYATYDTQPRRVIRNEVTPGSFGDQALAVAMANLLWRFERKTPAIRSKRAAATEVHEILAMYPRLLELRGFARKMVEYGRSSVMGYGAFVIERDDPKGAPVFLNALSTGADLPAGHPILALRRNLQKLRRENASQAEQLSALLVGWRHYKSYVATEQARRPRS